MNLHSYQTCVSDMEEKLKKETPSTGAENRRTSVGIIEDQPNEKGRGSLFRAGRSKGEADHPLPLAETQRQAEGRRASQRKRAASGGVLIGGFWPGGLDAD